MEVLFSGKLDGKAAGSPEAEIIQNIVQIVFLALKQIAFAFWHCFFFFSEHPRYSFSVGGIGFFLGHLFLRNISQTAWFKIEVSESTLSTFTLMKSMVESIE